MNTLYNLGRHLTLIGFAIHNDEFNHHVDITISGRKYPKQFSTIRRDFPNYRIEALVAIMEVIEINTNEQGQAIYHGRIVQHDINHVDLPAGTLCKSGAISSVDAEMRNSVWRTSGSISELMEIDYAYKLAKKARVSRNDGVSILLNHIDKIRDKLKR